MRREHVSLHSPAIGAPGSLIVYGDYGRPLIAFPSQEGRPEDWEDRGMIGSVAWLIESGRAKVYCVDSFDSQSWHDQGLPLDERARRHRLYESWILDQVVPWIHHDCAGPQEIVLAGCSFGAFHAANFTLKRADLFPVAICMSGVYDVSVVGDGARGDDVYFNNPMDYVAHMGGEHLDWLRRHANLVLVCGQGQWEDTTGALESTRRFAGLLAEKGIRHELDLWGYDVPHDWPSWRNQIAHHLQRFC
ncbi:MAG TPA: alpha/beta hydrolase-fold protein [Actinomycetota bacterium]|nr:alpha/beta hydrolase-fold protein [Actinomycetota bacterium]